MKPFNRSIEIEKKIEILMSCVFFGFVVSVGQKYHPVET